MKDRYLRNKIFTPKEQERLGKVKVAILGMGGLGCFVFEELLRAGVLKFEIFDGDVFSESNLNRQLYATEQNLGEKKVFAARDRASLVNSDAAVECFDSFLSREEISEKVKGCDLIIDCLDTAGDKILLEEIAEENMLPLVHAGISGWAGQVATSLPGDKTVKMLYEGVEIDDSLGNPSFTAALVASLEASEAIKVILGKGDILRRKVMNIDLLYNEFCVIELE